MAKKTDRKVMDFGKCEVCGEKHTSGRGKYSHYLKNEKCRPAGWKPTIKKETKEPLLEQEETATDLIRQAVAKLATEINTKREQLANVDKLEKEITKLENQREALKKMLPAETPI
jgi:DNA repair exonuclease SbcCD ATPase subunit